MLKRCIFGVQLGACLQVPTIMTDYLDPEMPTIDDTKFKHFLRNADASSQTPCPDSSLTETTCTGTSDGCFYIQPYGCFACSMWDNAALCDDVNGQYINGGVNGCQWSSADGACYGVNEVVTSTTTTTTTTVASSQLCGVVYTLGVTPCYSDGNSPTPVYSDDCSFETDAASGEQCADVKCVDSTGGDCMGTGGATVDPSFDPSVNMIVCSDAASGSSCTVESVSSDSSQ